MTEPREKRCRPLPNPAAFAKRLVEVCTMQTLICWSGGKDSALALDHVRRQDEVEVVGLLTTLSEEFDRISMHGVRSSLLEQQAHAIGLPLHKVFLPTPTATASCPMTSRPAAAGFTAFAPNDAYEAAMREALGAARDRGVEAVVFGDIFLEDLRAYRERLLGAAGLAGIFPLWKRDTDELLQEFVNAGFRAIVVCVEGSKLDARWLGRSLDDKFLGQLPSEVDPCGENGEFHTFVYDGPLFSGAVAFVRGDSVQRDPFCFLDLQTVDAIESQ